MIWFAYMVSPLGPSVRVRKSFVYSINEARTGGKGFVKLREVSVEGVEELYELVRIDPDTADLVREGVRKFTVGQIG
jgi:hypothetical protein